MKRKTHTHTDRFMDAFHTPIHVCLFCSVDVFSCVYVCAWDHVRVCAVAKTKQTAHPITVLMCVFFFFPTCGRLYVSIVCSRIFFLSCTRACVFVFDFKIRNGIIGRYESVTRWARIHLSSPSREGRWGKRVDEVTSAWILRRLKAYASCNGLPRR